ncbi:hypothetical protein [Kitasatospora terrestris]|uniref:hypothetical protein n=1 Tax=Kitasatospora terrestris TaxID=258051 RepID=UPI0031EBD58B
MRRPPPDASRPGGRQVRAPSRRLQPSAPPPAPKRRPPVGGALLNEAFSDDGPTIVNDCFDE